MELADSTRQDLSIPDSKLRALICVPINHQSAGRTICDYGALLSASPQGLNLHQCFAAEGDPRDRADRRRRRVLAFHRHIATRYPADALGSLLHRRRGRDVPRQLLSHRLNNLAFENGHLEARLFKLWLRNRFHVGYCLQRHGDTWESTTLAAGHLWRVLKQV